MSSFHRSSFLVHGVALALVLFSEETWAQRQYYDGAIQHNSTTCFVPGIPPTSIIVDATQCYTGYFADPNEPFPLTGDLSYVHAVASNISVCANDAPGFEFFLPDGASFAISTANPVVCRRGPLSTGAFEDVPNASNSSCSQTPSTGSNGGAFFGYSALPPDWYLEIRVPVLFTKKLLGIAGPSSHRLTIATSSTYGTIVADMPITIFYRAQLLNPASTGVTTTQADLAYELYSYYATGQAYFDFGTTSAFGSSTQAAGVPSGEAFAITDTLTGLTPGTTYHWRARFVTADGTFTTAEQTFTTAATPVFGLSVTKAGTGSGTVTSNPAGIACGATCSSNFAQGTNVALTASPSAGSTFSGWSGACSGSGACSVTMSASRSVTATFTLSGGGGSGGASGTGGTPGTGGRVGTGGALGTGGTPGTGGLFGTGGAVGSGGTFASGGADSGSPSTGGGLSGGGTTADGSAGTASQDAQPGSGAAAGTIGTGAGGSVGAAGAQGRGGTAGSGPGGTTNSVAGSPTGGASVTTDAGIATGDASAALQPTSGDSGCTCSQAGRRGSEPGLLAIAAIASWCIASGRRRARK